MKKTFLTLTVLALLFSCKNEQNHAENTDTDKTTETEAKDPTVPIEVAYKIKKIKKTDYAAENKFGKYLKRDMISTVIETFNEESLIQQVEIITSDLDSEHADMESNIYPYNAKILEDGNVGLYNDKDSLTEIEVHKNHALYSFYINSPEVPFMIRQYDEKGNYVFEVSNSASNDYIYVTDYTILEKDENGFATLTNAVWSQYKKSDNINYDNLDTSKLELLNKSYQVVEFEYELFE